MGRDNTLLTIIVQAFSCELSPMEPIGDIHLVLEDATANWIGANLGAHTVWPFGMADANARQHILHNVG